MQTGGTDTDTQSILRSLDQASGAIIPPNTVADKSIHHTCDNIDIQNWTLDGKNLELDMLWLGQMPWWSYILLVELLEHANQHSQQPLQKHDSANLKRTMSMSKFREKTFLVSIQYSSEEPEQTVVGNLPIIFLLHVIWTLWIHLLRDAWQYLCNLDRNIDQPLYCRLM